VTSLDILVHFDLTLASECERAYAVWCCQLSYLQSFQWISKIRRKQLAQLEIVEN